MRVNIKNTKQKQTGFTLIELMIVVAIIGILAAIAYPSYQRYVIKSKRTDMMSEMHNIASTIESRKLAQGKYEGMTISDLTGDYPNHGALYTVSIGNVPSVSGTDLTSKWQISAAPKSGTQMASDGTLTLNHQGIKCRDTGANKKCGTNDEWQ